MKLKSMVFLAAVLLLAAGCGPKIDAPKDVAAIKALSATYSAAASAGDASACVSGFYADGAVRLDCNAPIRIGKDAIQASLQPYFDQYNHRETDAVEEVHVVGDLAFARGTYSTKAAPKVPGGAVIEDQGKWVTAYRLQPGGAWRAVVDIWNSDLPVVQTLTLASADELALVQIERDWAAAWLKQDATTLEGILADGFVENWRGEVSTKAQLLANMKAGIYKVESCENSDMRVVVFGDHAVVNGLNREKQTLRGKDAGGADRWMDTFIKQDGRWRAAFSHLIKVE
jgi:ketosteroid isomerase-like protein